MNLNRIRPCSGPCRRDTRPSKSRADEFECTTILRYRGDACKSCYGLTVRQPDVYTIAGLESFLARRRDRENAMFRRELITTYPHLVREQVTA